MSLPKVNFSSTCWNKWISSAKKQKNNLNTDIISFTKIYSKWFIVLNVKHQTIKLLRDNIRENLDDLGYGNAFSIPKDMDP